MYMVGWRLGFVLTREWTQRFKGPRSSILYSVFCMYAWPELAPTLPLHGNK
jgi:hypothetical protein